MAPTMIITVTLGSSKQFSAGASAAPKFRAVVARLRTLRCEPPKQPAERKERGEKQQRGEDRAAADDAEERTEIERDHQHEEQQQRGVADLCRAPARRARRSDAAQFFTTMPAASGTMMSISSGRAMLHGSAVQAGDHQRQREGHEEDRARGQQRHERGGRREIAARGFDELWQEGRARRAAEQQQADGVAAVERDDDREQPRARRREDEVQREREQHEAARRAAARRSRAASA